MKRLPARIVKVRETGGGPRAPGSVPRPAAGERRPVLDGGQFAPPDFTPPTSLQAAQDLITSAAEDYAGALQRLSPEALGKTVQLPFGEFPMSQAVTMPIVDLIHHHGQIAYIQT